MTKKHSLLTNLIHKGRSPEHHFGAVNTPPFRASTILFKDYDSFKKADFSEKTPWQKGGLTYGRRNTPITFELAEMIRHIEGSDETILTCSGVAALAITMQSFLSSGDHVIIMDNVYTPTKSWIEHFGKKLNISYDIMPAKVTQDIIGHYFKENTKLIMLESPGSLTFEIADIPMITAFARERNVISALDNTWSAGVFFNALEKGCDISIQAGTKYYMGHSDGCFGSISCHKKYAQILRKTNHLMGQSLDADTAFLALRGIRTLDIRLKQHMQSALEVASFLDAHPKIQTVLYPALETSPDYPLWKRDFTGASGLFSFILNDSSEDTIRSFVQALSLFKIGFSWGGYESLIMPCLADNLNRKHQENVAPNQIPLRIHIGLECPKDLIHDLTLALENIS